MKNFKIAMILVAAVAFFCSCGDPEAPTASLTGDFSTFDLAKTNDTTIMLTLKADAPKGIDAIKGTVSYLNDKDSVMKQGTFDVEVTAGEKTYEGTLKCELKKAEIKDYAKIEYSVVVTTKKDVTSDPAVYTITIAKPKFTEGTFTWKRDGTTVTPDLAAYGLEWAGTTTDLKTTFKPVSGGKLYVLAAADFEKTSAEDVATLLKGKTPVEKYNGISASAGSSNITDVLATVNGEKTYLFKFDKSTVVSRATTITLNGTYRLFKTVEAQQSK